MVTGWLLLTVKPGGNSPIIACTASGFLKSAAFRTNLTTICAGVPWGTDGLSIEEVRV